MNRKRKLDTTHFSLRKIYDFSESEKHEILHKNKKHRHYNDLSSIPHLIDISKSIFKENEIIKSSLTEDECYEFYY